MAGFASSKIDKTSVVIFALIIIAGVGVALLLLSITDRSEQSVEDIKSVRVKDPTTPLSAFPTSEEANLALSNQVDGDLTVRQKIITECDFSEESFKKLTGYKHLKKLCLYQCNFDNAWLESLLVLPLRHLEFDGSNFNRQGLLVIRKLPSLRVLSVRGTKLENSDLAQLPPQLTIVRLGNTFTDQGMKHVADLKDLKILELHNLPITDETINTLRQCQTLTSLKVERCPRVTHKALLEFQHAVPKCSFVLVH